LCLLILFIERVDAQIGLFYSYRVYVIELLLNVGRLKCISKWVGNWNSVSNILKGLLVLLVGCWRGARRGYRSWVKFVALIVNRRLDGRSLV
jgi:hypothetical protein